MMIVLLCVAQFVVVLDVTIVAIVLPAMQADLGITTTTLSWVVTAYPLTFGGFLLAAAHRPPGRPADVPGAVLATGALATLVLALTWAEADGLSVPTIAAGAVAAVVRPRRGPRPAPPRRAATGGRR